MAKGGGLSRFWYFSHVAILVGVLFFYQVIFTVSVFDSCVVFVCLFVLLSLLSPVLDDEVISGMGAGRGRGDYIPDISCGLVVV